MVLDATKVVIGRPLPDADVLWIAEQVPGLVATMDVTAVLAAKQFWPSYNIAYVRRKQSLRAVRTDCVVELRESRVLVVELDLLSATFWLCVYCTYLTCPLLQQVHS
eukprot:COSAG06_NODE_18155_length_901_cov_19.130923_2_plen_107_part_00